MRLALQVRALAARLRPKSAPLSTGITLRHCEGAKRRSNPD